MTTVHGDSVTTSVAMPQSVCHTNVSLLETMGTEVSFCQPILISSWPHLLAIRCTHCITMLRSTGKWSQLQSPVNAVRYYVLYLHTQQRVRTHARTLKTQRIRATFVRKEYSPNFILYEIMQKQEFCISTLDKKRSKCWSYPGNRSSGVFFFFQYPAHWQTDIAYGFIVVFLLSSDDQCCKILNWPYL